jgi:hypothetical protein
MRLAASASSESAPFERHALKAKVHDAATVSRQVLECVESVEAVDRDLRDDVRFRKPKVDGDPAAPVLVLPLRAPERHAAAERAEVEFNGISANV